MGRGLLRTTLCLMGRKPDGSIARANMVTLRMTATELAALDRQRKLRGGADRSDYIRKLILQDGARLAYHNRTEKP